MLEIYSLIDITQTNIHRNVLPQGSALSQERWDFLRNQQRNWDTVIQLLGLRFQPLDINAPERLFLVHQDPVDFGFGEEFRKYENMVAWKFTCRYEQQFDLQLIQQDFDRIPIITGLNESVGVSQSCFVSGGKNCNIALLSKR